MVPTIVAISVTRCYAAHNARQPIQLDTTLSLNELHIKFNEQFHLSSPLHFPVCSEQQRIKLTN
jgi:hypothetical protein